MIVKVCGMREPENIRQVEALSIDWMGLIFWPNSRRYVSQPPSYLPTKVKRIGVFVDTTVEDILQHIEDYGLDLVQLHGQESPAFAAQIREKSRFPMIKAFNISSAEDFLQTAPYHGLVDYFLFDTKGKSVGGNGEKFDWSILRDYQGQTPFILSGGIGPDDAERVKAFRHPLCAGIDLNSRFETAPGVKDITRLQHFIEQLNNSSL